MSIDNGSGVKSFNKLGLAIRCKSQIVSTLLKLTSLALKAWVVFPHNKKEY
jgi:hypothetical protein